MKQVDKRELWWCQPQIMGGRSVSYKPTQVKASFYPVGVGDAEEPSRGSAGLIVRVLSARTPLLLLDACEVRSLLLEVGAMMPVVLEQDGNAHPQVAGNLVHVDALLHHPSRARMSQDVWAIVFTVEACLGLCCGPGAVHLPDGPTVEVDDVANACRHVSLAPSLQEPPQLPVNGTGRLPLSALRLGIALPVDGVAGKVNPSVLRIAHPHELANRAGTSAGVNADE